MILAPCLIKSPIHPSPLVSSRPKHSLYPIPHSPTGPNPPMIIRGQFPGRLFSLFPVGEDSKNRRPASAHQSPRSPLGDETLLYHSQGGMGLKGYRLQVVYQNLIPRPIIYMGKLYFNYLLPVCPLQIKLLVNPGGGDLEFGVHQHIGKKRGIRPRLHHIARSPANRRGPSQKKGHIRTQTAGQGQKPLFVNKPFMHGVQAQKDRGRIRGPPRPNRRPPESFSADEKRPWARYPRPQTKLGRP